MPFRWELRQVLAAKCGVTSATALQNLLAESEVTLSLESTSSLLRSAPKAIRFRTMQALCTATGLKLSDFCEILPEHAGQQNSPGPLYPGCKSAGKSAPHFPSPRNFFVPRRSKG